MNSSNKKKIETGIPGLDELLDGGIPRGNSVLLSGGAGSGKTTFGMQFLVNGAEYDEPGVFVGLEEYLPDLKKNMSHFGWDFASLEKENKLILTRLDIWKFGSVLSGGVDMDLFATTVRSAVEEINAQRIVIDPISIMGLMYRSDLKFRLDLVGLQNSLRDLKCTTIMVLDTLSGFMSRYNTEEFVAHGVIVLHYIKKNYIRQRGLEIWKMRGTKHSENVHSMEITSNGLKVYSGSPVFL